MSPPQPRETGPSAFLVLLVLGTFLGAFGGVIHLGLVAPLRASAPEDWKPSLAAPSLYYQTGTTVGRTIPPWRVKFEALLQEAVENVSFFEHDLNQWLASLPLTGPEVGTPLPFLEAKERPLVRIQDESLEWAWVFQLSLGGLTTPVVVRGSFAVSDTSGLPALVVKRLWLNSAPIPRGLDSYLTRRFLDLVPLNDDQREALGRVESMSIEDNSVLVVLSGEPD